MPKITIFKNPKSPDKVVGSDEVNNILQDIKFGKWKDEIEHVRSLEGDDKKKAKNNLPQLTWSGAFSYRSDKDLIEHSGFICVDIDDEDAHSKRQQLCDDDLTRALFTTSGGRGLAVLVKVKPSDHKGSFRWLQKYYFEKFGIVIDAAKSAISSGQNVSYDPKLFKRDKSKQAGTLRPPKPKRNRTIPVVIPNDKIGELVNQIANRNVDLAPDYRSYVELGFALSSGLGEEGRDHFHRLCQVNEKYNERHCDKQYDYCLKGKNDGITIGTFFYMAKEAGFEIPKDESYEKIARTVEIGKRSGRKQNEVIETMTKVDGVDKNLAEKVATQVYSRSDLKSDKKTEFFKMYRHYLTSEFELTYNTVKMRTEIDGFPMDDAKLNDIYTDAMEIFGSDVKKSHTKDLIDKLSRQNSYDPFARFYEENKHLDPDPKIIDRFISTVKSDTEGYEVFIRKWLISLAAAAIDREPVRYVLIFTGNQFAGKTEFFARLLPDELDEYFCLMIKDSNIADERLKMCTHLIMMDDDMDGNSWKDDRTLKYHSSAKKFSQRLKYGIMPSELRRLSVFCGNSNDENVITDPTGNTRLIPIRITGMDFEQRDEINRSELLVAVMNEYKKGAEWQLSKKEFSELNNVSEDHQATNFEGELIDIFFKQKDLSNEYEEKLTATEIKDYIERNSVQRIQSMRKLGIALGKQFEYVTSNGRRVYKVVKKKDVQSQMVWNDVPDDDEGLPF